MIGLCTQQCMSIGNRRSLPNRRCCSQHKRRAHQCKELMSIRSYLRCEREVSRPARLQTRQQHSTLWLSGPGRPEQKKTTRHTHLCTWPACSIPQTRCSQHRKCMCSRCRERQRRCTRRQCRSRRHCSRRYLHRTSQNGRVRGRGRGRGRRGPSQS